MFSTKIFVQFKQIELIEIQQTAKFKFEGGIKAEQWMRYPLQYFIYVQCPLSIVSVSKTIKAVSSLKISIKKGIIFNISLCFSRLIFYSLRALETKLIYL